ncbi:MAG: metallophosphoesterase [Phycisphaerales bacterium]|nr:metallophosphoesterase [Phycisphaerales bacterium]
MPRILTKPVRSLGHEARVLAPAPLECYELAHPAVPQTLEGFRILHIADLHTRRPWGPDSTVGRLIDALPRFPVDLVVLTGDYADQPGQEPAAVRTLKAIASAWRSRLGAVGVFGNHDPARLKTLLPKAMPEIRWLHPAGAVGLPGVPLRVLGASYPEDVSRAVIAEREMPPEDDTLRILLTHMPTEIFPAETYAIPLHFAGHTHGGQLRLSPKLAPHTSSDLPSSLASGLLRHHGTLCAISRGLGEGFLQHLRLNCPPQAPIYTLKRGPALGRGAPLHCALPW